LIDDKIAEETEAGKNPEENIEEGRGEISRRYLQETEDSSEEIVAEKDHHYIYLLSP
jgi:hypothetical protein